MTQKGHVPARETVPDTLREAARFGLEPQPGTLPSGVKCLYAAIDATLDPLRRVKEQLRRSIVSDVNITPCAERARKRLVPTAVHRMVRDNSHLFALHDVPRSYAPRAFRSLAFFRGCGIPASSLKNLDNPVRDEHIRRVCGDSVNYSALARRHDLTPGASARSTIPVEPLATAVLHPNCEEEITSPFQKVHAIPAGGR